MERKQQKKIKQYFLVMRADRARRASKPLVQHQWGQRALPFALTEGLNYVAAEYLLNASKNVLGVGKWRDGIRTIAQTVSRENPERAMKEKRIPEMNVYIQGMIWDVTAIHTAYPDFLSPRIKREIFQKRS